MSVGHVITEKPKATWLEWFSVVKQRIFDYMTGKKEMPRVKNNFMYYLFDILSFTLYIINITWWHCI